MLFTGVGVLFKPYLVYGAGKECWNSLFRRQLPDAVGGMGNNVFQMPRNELKYDFHCQKPAYFPRINFWILDKHGSTSFKERLPAEFRGGKRWT